MWTSLAGVGLIQSSSFLGQLPSGFFTKGTYPRQHLYSLASLFAPNTLARRLPQPTALPLARSRRFHGASGTVRQSDDSPSIASHFALAYRVAYPVARNRTSPPGVTHHSSLPCRPHTPWYDGWMRTPSPPYCRLDLAPSLADRFITGLSSSIAAR